MKKKILMNYKRVEQIHQAWKNIGEENTAELNKACFNVVVYMGAFLMGLSTEMPFFQDDIFQSVHLSLHEENARLTYWLGLGYIT